MTVSPDERARLVALRRRDSAWTPLALGLLGLWLLTTPSVPGASIPGALAVPPDGLHAWLPLPARLALFRVNDLVCGAGLVLCALGALAPGNRVHAASRWIAALLGGWLFAAPILAWAPSAFTFFNEQTVGVLAVAVAVLLPGLPGLTGYGEPGPMVPPGWSANPSSWARRTPKIVLAFLGWSAARYLASYQLGYVAQPWDPVFGADSSSVVLTSSVSRALPVSDGGLGALAYGMDVLLAWLGPAERWRAAPWAVLLHAGFVLPTAGAAVFLAVAQPLVVGRWCLVCLLSSAVMLPVVPLMLDELAASLVFLARVRRSGKSWLRALFAGGALPEADSVPAPPAPHPLEAGRHPGLFLRHGLRGVGLPWNLVASILLGVWCMLAPGLLDRAGSGLAVACYLAGPLMVVLAVVACSELARGVRLANLPIGLALAVAAVALPAGWDLTFSVLLAGLATAGLALPRGGIRQHYGSLQGLIV